VVQVWVVSMQEIMTVNCLMYRSITMIDKTSWLRMAHAGASTRRVSVLREVMEGTAALPSGGKNVSSLADLLGATVAVAEMSGQ